MEAGLDEVSNRKPGQALKRAVCGEPHGNPSFQRLVYPCRSNGTTICFAPQSAVLGNVTKIILLPPWLRPIVGVRLAVRPWAAGGPKTGRLGEIRDPLFATGSTALRFLELGMRGGLSIRDDGAEGFQSSLFFYPGNNRPS